jgi:tetratricopeptide (TPR) repeat protein
MRRSLSLVLAAACLMASAPAVAQDESAPDLGSGLTFTGAPTMQEILAQAKACEARKPSRRAGTISEVTYRRMERILVAVGKNEYAESEQKLVELAENAREEYEKAVIQQTLAYVYALQNKYAKAIAAYEAALATEALPHAAHEQMMFNIAQMYMSENKMDKGEQMLKRYMELSCNPVPEAHISLAMILAERKAFRESLKQADLSLIKSKAPKESWLQLKLALHFELKELARCAEVLVHLIALSPMKETYFKQLHGVLTEIKKDSEALAVLALTERRGFLDEEKEYVNLSNMYLFMEIPLKAARILDRGLEAKHVQPTEKNLEKLANAWFAARETEKAEAAMARAAQASDKGDLWKQLGSIQMEAEKWKEALASLQKAQQKGGSKNPGEVQFLIGVTATQLKQWKTAETALRAAMQHEKFVKPATEWLGHLQQEQAYYEATSGGNDDSAPAAEDARS